MSDQEISKAIITYPSPGGPCKGAEHTAEVRKKGAEIILHCRLCRHQEPLTGDRLNRWGLYHVSPHLELPHGGWASSYGIDLMGDLFLDLLQRVAALERGGQ